jgi:hypothetical protein
MFQLQWISTQQKMVFPLQQVHSGREEMHRIHGSCPDSKKKEGRGEEGGGSKRSENKRKRKRQKEDRG